MRCTCFHAHEKRDSTYSGSNQFSDPNTFISNRGKWRYFDHWERHAPEWVASDGRARFESRFEKFIPLHTVCEKLLQRFLLYQCQSDSTNLPKSVTEFIDACTACQEFSKEESGIIRQCNQRALRPWDYDRYGSVEWPHLYFGARRFWSAPWDCVPGHEYLCADPMAEPETYKWLIQCLACPNLSFTNLLSLLSKSQLQLTDSSSLSESPLMQCPTEILRLIASHLPLRSALNLHASSRRLSTMINENQNNFWRSYTLRLHGHWVWELETHPSFVSTEGIPPYANWQNLLIMLSQSRSMIMTGARPWWLASSSRPSGFASSAPAAGPDQKIQETAPSPPMPLTLRNRQRIWMCLEFLDVTGDTVKVEAAAGKRGGLVYRPAFS